jgi:predicted neuraminidase
MRIEPEKQPFQVIQPTLLVHPDGTIRALMRSKHEKIAVSLSTDSGHSWSELELTNMPNNNSGIEALTLADGRHLLLYNHTAGRKDRKDGWGRRNVINLAISDDGIEWKAAAVIERADTGEFSYPAMIQTKDGLVHMTYTWNRKKIRHVVIDPGKLETQELSSFDQ